MKYANIIVTIISLVLIVWGIIINVQATNSPITSPDRLKKQSQGGTLIVIGIILISVGNMLAVWLRLETKTI